MFEQKGSAAQARRIATLERKLENATSENEALRRENEKLTDEVMVCRMKLEGARKAESDFREAVEQAKRIGEQYELAYESLMTLKAEYSAEIKKLLRQMTH